MKQSKINEKKVIACPPPPIILQPSISLFYREGNCCLKMRKTVNYSSSVPFASHFILLTLVAPPHCPRILSSFLFLNLHCCPPDLTQRKCLHCQTTNHLVSCSLLFKCESQCFIFILKLYSFPTLTKNEFVYYRTVHHSASDLTFPLRF